MLKRRSFLQGIAASVYALIFGKKIIEYKGDSPGFDQHGEFLEMLKRDHEANTVEQLDALGEPWTKEPQYELGTRKVMPDGRVFRYIKHDCPTGQLIDPSFYGDLAVTAEDGWIQIRGFCPAKIDGKEEMFLLNGV